jgi:hypothetical protein
MKLRSTLIAAAFAILMAGGPGCPCGGDLSDNGNVPGAETFYCGYGDSD